MLQFFFEDIAISSGKLVKFWLNCCFVHRYYIVDILDNIDRNIYYDVFLINAVIPNLTILVEIMIIV